MENRVIMLPGQAAVEAYRKQAARRGDAASFGATVTTPASWLAGLWAVHGDGRAIASDMQRSLALSKALEGQDGLSSSPGMVGLLRRLVEGGLGAPELDAALADTAALGSAHEPLLKTVCAYERILASAGLVDGGRAWSLLARESVVAHPTSVEFRGVEPSAALRAFCAAQDAVVDVRIDDAARGIGAAGEGVQVRFAFPSGRYAEPLLLVDMVREIIGDGRVVITARQPLSLYRAVAPALAREGVACAMQGRVRFGQTDFGRAFLCVFQVLACDGVARQAASDYVLNPFSGAPKDAAYRFDRAVRADRALEKGALLAALRSTSPAFEYFEDMAQTPDAGILAGLFEDRARAMEGASEAYVREQLAAIGCLREAAQDARGMGLSMDACVALLGQGSVDASRACGGGEPRVIVMGQHQAAMLEAGSVAAVVMCDMDSVSYPLRERADAASALLDAAGIARSESPLAEARRVFSAVEALPTRHLVIVRRLNDENAAPTYPAAVIEEFVDCYRADPSDMADIDNRYALPPCFLDGRIERGEESLYENAALSHEGQPVAASVAMPMLWRATDAMAGRIAVPRALRDGAPCAPARFSASQIESYLECPQKWFATRRLRLDELDEGFGPVEMGDFSHGALRRFYERFQAEVAPKVDAGTLAAAHAIMGQIVDERMREQAAREPKSGRLLAVTELERRQAAELAGRIDAYLDYEAALLPGFHPAYLEYDIASQGSVEYAGYGLVGAIDRIDVDDEGHAVVIDYKSSLSPDYDLYDAKGQLRGGKVQALIYAQVARRCLGLDVVGALYVGYGRRPKAAGALDRRIEPSHIPGCKPARCVYGEGPLSDMLDAVEERVADALARLVAGDIQASPSHGGACAWCPEISCPKRQG